MGKKYYITIVPKILITLFILNFINLIAVCTQYRYIENKKQYLTIDNKIFTACNFHLVKGYSMDEDVSSCIASFSTNFESSSDERVNNIDICIKAINGKLLMPGEVFSFNDVVGERTKERGYLEAPVIIDNKVETGVGGGVCQVSSTLYNAILKAGIQQIQRTHHSLPSSYVGLGLDAAVDWGNIDLKFTNTLSYPIYIEGYTENKNLYINIFSNSDLTAKKYVIENDVSSDNNVYTATVTRKTYENETLINSELISNDIYKPENSEI